jgi:hypothetical protein
MISPPPDYQELDETSPAEMKKEMLTGEKCCDEAIMAGKHPKSPEENPNVYKYPSLPTDGYEESDN